MADATSSTTPPAAPAQPQAPAATPEAQNPAPAAPAAGAAPNKDAPPQQKEKESPFLTFIKSIFEGAMGGLMALIGLVAELFSGGKHDEHGAGQNGAQAGQSQNPIAIEVANDLSTGKKDGFDKAAATLDDLAQQQNKQAADAVAKSKDKTVKILHGSDLMEHAQGLATEARGLEIQARRLDTHPNHNTKHSHHNIQHPNQKATPSLASTEHAEAFGKMSKARDEQAIGSVEEMAKINQKAADVMRNDPGQVDKLLKTKIGNKTLEKMLANPKEQQLATQYIVDKLGGGDKYAQIDKQHIMLAQKAVHDSLKNNATGVEADAAASKAPLPAPGAPATQVTYSK